MGSLPQSLSPLSYGLLNLKPVVTFGRGAIFSKGESLRPLQLAKLPVALLKYGGQRFSASWSNVFYFIFTRMGHNERKNLGRDGGEEP